MISVWIKENSKGVNISDKTFFPWDALEAEIVALVNLVASWDWNFSDNYRQLTVFLTPHFAPSQW